MYIDVSRRGDRFNAVPRRRGRFRRADKELNYSSVLPIQSSPALSPTLSPIRSDIRISEHSFRNYADVPTNWTRSYGRKLNGFLDSALVYERILKYPKFMYVQSVTEIHEHPVKINSISSKTNQRQSFCCYLIFNARFIPPETIFITIYILYYRKLINDILVAAVRFSMRVLLNSKDNLF